MSIFYVLGMTAAELFGNAHLKWYAQDKRHHNLLLGILAWLLCLALLIKTLESQSLMWTCIMWEAAIVLGGAVTAYYIFGEKLDHWIQWLGIAFAIGAAICINYQCDK